MDYENMFSNMRSWGLGVLFLVVSMLVMVIIPLPTPMLDVFFTMNIALSLIVLMVCVYVQRPLEFSIFPTLLLITTLLRLSLNIASTRVVLLNGHTGVDAAGQVIRAFGEVVIGGSFIVGLIVFAILMIINFVVITKGAGRISEVTARFTLDAMPGKQMAIDSDLNAGLISQDDARKRREDVMQEADFYGSMDGASKFVRGDAIAALLILLINLIGGIIIGVFEHHMPLALAVQNFSILTIGDGLVAQIPSLLMSIAAAIMVTRVSNEHNIAHQAVSQLLSDTKPIYIAAFVLLLFSLIPSMPHIPFMFLSLSIIGFAYFLNQRKQLKEVSEAVQSHESLKQDMQNEESASAKEIEWDDVVSNDRLALEVGYGLVPLVGSNCDGLLANRVRGIRKKLSQELGFLIPQIHIKDDLTLSPTRYKILLKNVMVAEGDAYADMLLAINPGYIKEPLAGVATKDPTFGMDAVWIQVDQRDHAKSLGFAIVDVSTVIATHFNQIIINNANQLLGYDEVQQMYNRLTESSPKLIETVTSGPQAVPINIVVTVLQRLLQGGVPLIDMRTVIEKIIESWAKAKDVEVVLENVRNAVKKLIVYKLCNNEIDVPVAVFEHELAQILHKSIHDNKEAGERMLSLEPTLAERVFGKLLEYVKHCEVESLPAILLVGREMRSLIERLFKPSMPNLHILSHEEIPEDRQLKLVAKIG